MTLEELTENKEDARFISDELGNYFSRLDIIESDDAKKAKAIHDVLFRHIDEYDRQIDKIVSDIRRGK